MAQPNAAFHMRDVFDVLYLSSCRALDGVLKFPGCEAIGKCMELLEPPRRATSFNIVERHRAVLVKHREAWQSVKGSHATCFICLRRQPEHRLECGHIICAHCVKRFGERPSKRVRRVTLPQCPLCGSPCSLTVLDRPPTAGIGVLCLDGGGVRGVVQTVILTLIEQQIGLPIAVQEYFQLVGGVSAGGLNAISLFLMGWATAKCTAMYETIAASIFQRSLWHRVPLISAIATVCGSSLYPAARIEQAISDAYGKTARMLDASYASSIGARVLLPVATSPDPSLLLFTNYGTVGDPGARIGYRVYNRSGDVYVADVARSCTAAPIFFPLKYISQIGSRYQDAGLIDNNVISLMPAEFAALFPGSVCQFIVNIGTGSGSQAEPQSAWTPFTTVANFLWQYVEHNALNRVRLGLEHLLSGKTNWEKHVNGRAVEPLADRNVRLDVELRDGEPRLDDAGGIAALKQAVLQDAQLAAAIAATAKRMVASLFYFELDAPPEQCGHLHTASGRIRCERTEDDLPLLVSKLVAEQARFVINGSVIGGCLFAASAWDPDGTLAIPVSLRLVAPSFDLSLRWPGGEAFPIGGGPFLFSRLVRAQGLDCHFGDSIVAPHHAPAAQSVAPTGVPQTSGERRKRPGSPLSSKRSKKRTKISPPSRPRAYSGGWEMPRDRQL